MINILQQIVITLVALIEATTMMIGLYEPQIEIIDVHSRYEPEWSIAFNTEGLTDLVITPDGDNTEDLEFISLKCGGIEKVPENWNCSEEGEVIYSVSQAREHTLRFEFGNTAFAYNSPALIDNLISYWKFDDTDDTNAVDAHGSNDGTQTGLTDEATGKIETAFSFDGSGDYVNVVDSASLGFSDGLTISFWAYRTAESDDILARNLFDKRDPSGWTGEYGAYTKLNGLGYFNINTDGTSPSIAGVAGLYAKDTWVHVVMTWNGSRMDIYKDGAYFNGDDGSGNIINNARPLRIGIRSDLSNNAFKGSIDEVGIWNRALTDDEVTELYNSGAGLAYPFSVAVRRIIIIQ